MKEYYFFESYTLLFPIALNVSLDFLYSIEYLLALFMNRFLSISTDTHLSNNTLDYPFTLPVCVNSEIAFKFQSSFAIALSMKMTVAISCPKTTLLKKIAIAILHFP